MEDDQLWLCLPAEGSPGHLPLHVRPQPEGGVQSPQRPPATHGHRPLRPGADTHLPGECGRRGDHGRWQAHSAAVCGAAGEWVWWVGVAS